MSSPLPVTTVMLVDDHVLVRAGIGRLLQDEPDLQVVGEAGDPDEAMRLCRRLSPDVCVLDMTLGTRSGLEIIGELRDLGTRVVILSMQDEPAYARVALEAGALGYVVKDAAETELVEAIRLALADRLYVHPSLAAKLVQQRSDDDLTDREREVLRLIALGHTNQDIAKMAFLSVRTVEAHRRHILQKLRLSTRADLVRYALEHGIIRIGRNEA